MCISIHAAREGGDTVIIGTNVEYGISIHAAREGGDTDGSDEYARIMISIHAAREGGDHRHNLHRAWIYNFNPRRP